jgi:hypothetical protein
VGLLFQQGGEGSFGQASSGGGSDLLHGVQIDTNAWTGLTEGVPGNDLSPA